MESKPKPPSRLRTITASDIMTEHVIVINKEMPLDQAAHLMLRDRISGYPIADENMEIIGVVTLTDLFVLIDKMAKEAGFGIDTKKDKKKLLEENIALVKDMPIKEIMTKNVISVPPDMPVLDIIEAVVKWNIHFFPVMERKKLVGIVSRHDILNATFSFG
jgi:CBS domain-containing protein